MKFVIVKMIVAIFTMAPFCLSAVVNVDGHSYPIVKIGKQVWMAKNLNVKTADSWCYGNKQTSCDEFGRFYTWSDAQKVCPSGWHLPSKEEFASLLTYVGSSEGERFKNLQANAWRENSDKFGFSALPAGYHDNDSYNSGFHFHGMNASFWSSSKHNNNKAHYLKLQQGVFSDDAKVSNDSRDKGFSVRCLQDSNKVDEDKIPKIVKDKKTKIVKIGNHVWMARNLNVNVPGSVCFNNDSANCKNFGRLYSWEAAKNACPAGWRLPEALEIKELLENVGSSERERSGNLRASEWGGGSNKFSFSALPAGEGHDSKLFFGLDQVTSFWSSSLNKYDRIYILQIGEISADINSGGSSDYYSVRCIKESNKSGEESLPVKDSQDGKTYKTAKIGRQVWMAENLNKNIAGSMCYDNNPANCEKYGRLYTWDAAKIACPSGWHLPNIQEIDTLVVNAGYEDEKSRNLRAVTWNDGFDKYGFSVLPAGEYTYHLGQMKSVSLGNYACFWTSTESNGDGYAYRLNFSPSRSLYIDGGDVSQNWHSVRCLKD